jgi:hypothetical protein
VNKSIPILLRACVWLSFAVMLVASAFREAFFMMFAFLLGGHPVLGSGSTDAVGWAYMIFAWALPFVFALLYFKWPWGPMLLCWGVLTLNLLLTGTPLGNEIDSYYYTRIAFLLSAHLALISYLILKQSGLWPIKVLRKGAPA